MFCQQAGSSGCSSATSLNLNAIGLVMDNRCPNCNQDLGGKFLKTKAIEGAFKRMKVPVPICPNCKTLLTVTRNEFDKSVLLTAAFLIAIFGVTRAFFEQYSWHVGITLIFIAIFGVIWYNRFFLKRVPRWRVYDEADAREVSRRAKRHGYHYVYWRRPTRRITLSYREYFQDLLLSTLFFVPLVFIFGLRMDFTPSEFILSGILFFVVICIWRVILALYDMGDAWEFSILMLFVMFSMLIALAVYP